MTLTEIVSKVADCFLGENPSAPLRFADKAEQLIQSYCDQEALRFARWYDNIIEVLPNTTWEQLYKQFKQQKP